MKEFTRKMPLDKGLDNLLRSFTFTKEGKLRRERDKTAESVLPGIYELAKGNTVVASLRAGVSRLGFIPILQERAVFQTDEGRKYVVSLYNIPEYPMVIKDSENDIEGKKRSLLFKGTSLVNALTTKESDPQYRGRVSVEEQISFLKEIAKAHQVDKEATQGLRKNSYL